MPSKENWYIVKQDSEECMILSEQALEASTRQQDETGTSTQSPVQWGPFETQSQAIAKRIGLIRAGKCQPVR